MPRYEFKEGKSNKFWEIELEDDSFTTRFGRIGSDGQESTKSFDSRAEAKREYEKLIAEKVKKGYQLVSEGGGDAPPAAKTNPELEAAILANPDDVHAYEVYGDWLQANGDLRGELVAIQVALSKAHDAGLSGRANELLSNNEELFYGDIAEQVRGSVNVTWRYGFFDKVRISMGYDDADGGADIDDIVSAVLTHPSGRFLRELTVGMFDYEGENHYPRIIKVLQKAGPKPTLRRLFLGDFEYPEETEISWANVGDIGKLWALYPNLESLELQGAEIELGKISAPKLKSMILRTGGLPAGALKSLAAATFPSLESLEVWTGSDSYGGDSTITHLSPLLTGKSFPKLTHLGVVNCGYVGEAVSALAKSKILGQLKSLDLSKGTLIDDETDPLLDKGAFGALSSLKLSENLLSDAACSKLASVCGKVDCSEQRDNDDPEYRYVCVSE
ncbi:MAG: WGR domain-containing protein [Polyangiaceae bacterium]|nr:WGR domain-containing protein [Polyangiaceae bacterium]